MIGKSEAIHAWTPPGAAEPAIELGRVKDDAGALIFPCFTIKRLTGFGSVGDPEDNRDRPPGQQREQPRKSLRRGKTITYEGTLKARSLLELREAEALFTAAFDDLSAEGRMDAFWHPKLLAARPAFAAIPPKFYEAKALTADIIDTQESQGWWRSYVVGLRMSDRRYFDEESEVHSVTLTNTNTTYDFT